MKKEESIYLRVLGSTASRFAERLSLIKVLFNSVASTLENEASGKYPLVKTLAFVFQQDQIPAKAKAFLNFIQSEAGEEILRANDYLPIKP